MSAVLLLGGRVEESRQRLNALVAEQERTIPRTGLAQLATALDDLVGRLTTIDEEEMREPELLSSCWEMVCGALRLAILMRRHSESSGARGLRLPWFLDYSWEYEQIDREITERLAETARTLLLVAGDQVLTVPNDLDVVIRTVRIPPLAYLRAMWNLFWSAIRHPFSETTIDLSTGRVLYRI